MKKVLAVFAMVILIAGIAYAKNYEVSKKAGEYNVKVEIDKNPPVAGDNNVEIEIKDASGKYVTDAKVVLDYTMPAMSGMPAMNYKENAVLKGNVYTAKMGLSMAGFWNVAVRITRAGKKTTMKFSVDAH